MDAGILLRGSPDVAPEPMEGTVLFTPRLSTRGSHRERVRLFVSRDDLDRFHRLRQSSNSRVIVTDVPSGKRFLVRRAACSIPTCFCAGAIVSELPS